MNFRRLQFGRLGVLVLLLVSFINSYASCEKDIKDFYITYMENLENDEALSDSICAMHLSESAKFLIKDYVKKTDINPLIRAQDVSKYGIKSLEVHHLEGNWYMVQYQWSPNDEQIKIPIKVCNCDTIFKIIYITPIWKDNQYGDYLLSGD